MAGIPVANLPLRAERASAIDLLRVALALWMLFSHLVPWSRHASGESTPLDPVIGRLARLFLDLGLIMAAPGALRRSGLARSGATGVYGISLGGMLANYYAALDPRVTAVEVSRWIEDRDRKLMGEPQDDPLWLHPDVQGLLPHFDDAAVASLIAPRALFIEVGREDGRARTAPASVYRELRLPRAAASLEVAPGGHDVVLNGARLFLDRGLRNARDPKLSDFCR